MNISVAHLCNLLGNDIENGEIPVCEMERVNQMVEDIAYNNAKKIFFNFNKATFDESLMVTVAISDIF